MKKIHLLGILVIGLIAGCGKKEPLASDKAISCGKQAIEAVTDYLNGDLSYDNASKKINSLTSDMSYVSEQEDDAEYHTEDFGIKVSILGISVDLIHDNYENSSDSYKELEDDIAELREKIGQ